MRFTGKHDPAALAQRLRAVFAGRRTIREKKMFGGVCFLLRGWVALAQRYVGALPAKRPAK